MGGGATFGGSINLTTQYAWVGTPGCLIQFNQPAGQMILQENVIDIENKLRHYGDSDTYMQYTDDKIKMQSGGNVFIEGTPTEVHFPLGISADAGATFGGDVNILGGLEVGGYWAGVQEETIGVSVNNGSSVLTTGVKGHRTLPYACDIVDWRVTSTESVEGEIDWGINYCTYANFPTMTAITQSHHTEITQLVSGDSNKAESADDIAGQWNKYQFDAGEIIEFEIDSVTTLTNCILELTIRRTS